MGTATDDELLGWREGGQVSSGLPNSIPVRKQDVSLAVVDMPCNLGMGDSDKNAIFDDDDDLDCSQSARSLRKMRFT